MAMIRALMVLLVIFCVSFPVAHARTVVLTTLSWEPYYGPELPDQGFVTELSRAAFSRMGYDLEIRFLPWARALKMAESGGSDGVLGGYYSEERAQSLAFSEPLYSVEVVFAKLKHRDIPYRSLEDLKPYSIGYTRGGVVNREFDAATFLRIEESVDQKNTLQRLLAGRIDLMMDARPVILHLLNGPFSGNADAVELLSPPVSMHPLYNAFSKKKSDYRELTAAFNEGLRLIKEDGTYRRILEKHRMVSPVQ
jgi:polar amino acid transport system substrate-binding protein